MASVRCQKDAACSIYLNAADCVHPSFWEVAIYIYIWYVLARKCVTPMERAAAFCTLKLDFFPCLDGTCGSCAGHGVAHQHYALAAVQLVIRANLSPRSRDIQTDKVLHLV